MVIVIRTTTTKTKKTTITTTTPKMTTTTTTKRKTKSKIMIKFLQKKFKCHKKKLWDCEDIFCISFILRTTQEVCGLLFVGVFEK